MNVIGDVLGLVACIASIISAYQDGGAIIQRIKAKRAEQRAPPPPTLLEESIGQAPEAIEKEKQRGIARFGKAFEDGDHVAVIALQRITIQLQGSLLFKLREAAYDDDVVDFTDLIDAADVGRDRTIGVLLELKERLLQASSVGETPAPHPHRPLPPPFGQTSGKTTSWPSQESTQVPSATEIQRKPSENHKSPVYAPKEEHVAAGASDSRQTTHHRHKSWITKFRHRRNDRDLKDENCVEIERIQSPLTQRGVLLKSSQDEAARPKFTYEEGEDNPFDIWGEQTEQLEDSQLRETLSTSPTIPNARNGSLSQTARRKLSKTPSTGPRGSVSNGSLQPTAANNYLGFCEGAARLQNGDRKSMLRKKEFNDGWSQSNVFYLACCNSKCAFAGHMDLDTIWSKVWNVSVLKGLKFRWPFLAKSHVCQSKAKNNQFAYQCIFCIFSGQSSPVMQGTDSYLDHVSETHRGRKLSEVVLYRTYCVNNLVCDDSEEFDINLFPLTDAEIEKRQSEGLQDELIIGPRKAGSDAQDSMFSNAPWARSLSDFHYVDEYEDGGRPSLRSFRSSGTGC